MSSAATNETYDIHFHFDPVCPFAWITSRWVQKVVAERDYKVDWQFISLRLINKEIDYDTHFPPEYEQGHTSGLRLLRVCAAARAAHGRAVVGDLYTEMGARIWDIDRPTDQQQYRDWMSSDAMAVEALEAAGLPASLASSLDDQSWDAEIDAEGDAALELTGKDVGTPIIAYNPPDGPAFFGPVISRIPHDDDAVRLWDAIIDLTSFPGFSELKRSLREFPALKVAGKDDAAAGKIEDWHQGSRRLKK